MKFVILYFTVVACIIAADQPAKPIKKGLHYAIYRESDLPKKERIHITEPLEKTFGSGKNLRTWVEYPYNDTVPVDRGSNFGDLEFSSTEKDGFLLGRETIVNDYYPYNIIIVYYKTYSDLYVKDFKVFNFGRERGYAYSATIYHLDGYVETEILVPATYQVRVFAEAYGDLL